MKSTPNKIIREECRSQSQERSSQDDLQNNFKYFRQTFSIYVKSMSNFTFSNQGCSSTFFSLFCPYSTQSHLCWCGISSKKPGSFDISPKFPLKAFFPKSVNTPRNGLKLSGRDRTDVSSLMMEKNKNLTFLPRQQKAIQESWTFLLKEEQQQEGLYIFKLPT